MTIDPPSLTASCTPFIEGAQYELRKASTAFHAGNDYEAWIHLDFAIGFIENARAHRRPGR